MNQELLNELINLILKVVVLLLSVYVIPKIKTLVEKKQTELEVSIGQKKFDTLKTLVTEAVKYVEENYRDELQKSGAEKKAAVVKFIQDKGFTDFDEETLDMIIENVVKEMNQYGVFTHKEDGMGQENIGEK